MSKKTRNLTCSGTSNILHSNDAESSEAKPHLKNLARFVLYYIHFTLLSQLAAASSLPLLAAGTALSLGSSVWFHLNERVQLAPVPSMVLSQTGIPGQTNLPHTHPDTLHICQSPLQSHSSSGTTHFLWQELILGVTEVMMHCFLCTLMGRG